MFEDILRRVAQQLRGAGLPKMVKDGLAELLYYEPHLT